MSAGSTSPGRPAADHTGAEPAGESLGARTASAARWQTASSAVKGFLQFGVMVILARLLGPEDFGLAALALIVVGFAEMVVDLGLGAALVQRAEVTVRQIRVSFTASALLGAAVSVVLVLAAPYAAVLLRDAAVEPVLRWQALLFVFAGLGATSRSVMERRMDFRGLFYVSLASYLVGYAGVGVALALLGWGVWSLVLASLAQALVGCAFALYLARHPMRPLLARAELRELLHFGFGVTLNRLVVYASYTGDNFVVGRWLGSAALGLYSRAFQLMLFPLTHLQAVTWNVLFSAYSRLQHDRERAAAAYLRGIRLAALLVAPLMAGMAVAGPHLVVGLYGPRWAAAAVPMQVLCAAGLFRAIYGMTGALTHAFGRVYAEFRRQAVFAGLLIVAAWFGSRWGLTGVATGVAASVAVMYLVMAQLGRSIVGYGWGEFFAAQIPGVTVAAVVASAATAVRLAMEHFGWSSLATLGAIFLACAAALPAGLLLLPDRWRPAELFGGIESAMHRLPTGLRSTLCRMMRLNPEHAQAAP